ncbi:MAG: histone deacetylase [Bacillota bacterium]|nr:histone deacetylase [Bacillota bacterium]
MNGKGEKIGIVYHPDYLLHTRNDHPERMERLKKIIDLFDEKNVLERIEMIKPELAEVEEVALIHDPEYIRSIDKACRSGQKYLDMDTYIVPDSYRVALLSAGGALSALRGVLSSNPRRIFALNRPPGHHAERRRAMGFCIFNNVAIAAAKAISFYGLNKIAIVDWDVHHGNGTQHSFESDPNVLYISTHQSPAYPGTGDIYEVGIGPGEGYTINIPLPPGSGDPEYLMFFNRLIIPVLEQFEPELIIVSAGQDIYSKDPLAGMLVTHQGFYRMTEALADLSERYCGGKVMFCLEGGYHLDGQAGAVLQVLNALGRWELEITEESEEREPRDDLLQHLQGILHVQNKYWDL